MGIFKDIILYNLCVLLALICSTKQDEGFVSQVRQFYEEKLNNKLEQQISHFNSLELVYRAYAAYFGRADVDLPGFRKFFQELEEHSRDNAVSITTYINNRGGRVRFPVVQLKHTCEKLQENNDLPSTVKPNFQICYYQSHALDRYDAGKTKKKTEKGDNLKWRETSGLLGLQDALALEKSVNKHLIHLVEEAKKFNDPHAKITIEHFLEHQVETIKKLADLVTKLQQYQQDGDYPLGEYLLDKDFVNKS